MIRLPPPKKAKTCRWNGVNSIDNAGDTRGGVDMVEYSSALTKSRSFVVVCAFTPNPEILVCGTSLGKGEEPFTPLELRKFPGDDDAADFPYDSDILFCTDDDIIVGFGDDENAAVAKPELIFFPSLKTFFFLFPPRSFFTKGAFVFFHPFKRRDLNEETFRVFFLCFCLEKKKNEE